MRLTRKHRRAAVVGMATAALLAVAAPANAAEANMSEVWDGSRFRGMVEYRAGSSQRSSQYSSGEVPDEFNVVTLSMAGQDVLIHDAGARIASGWGVFASYGCTSVSNGAGGTDPNRSRCVHPNGTAVVKAELLDKDDFFTADATVPSGIALDVRGESGNDTIVVRDGAGNDYAHCGPGADWVFYDPGDYRSGDCESESLGGVLTSGPAAASWGTDRLDAFVRGTDDALYHRWFDGGYWSGWERLGGGLTSDPAAVSSGYGKLDVFVRGTDNGLWQLSWDGYSWSTWKPLGGTLTSSPAAASCGAGDVAVYYRGAAGDLRGRTKASPYAGFSAEYSLGGQLTSDPAAVCWTDPNLRSDVFVRGTDGALYQTSSVWGWQGWARFDGQLSSGPAVASRGRGLLDVVVLGVDGNLYRNSWSGAWSDWFSIGGRGELTSDPELVSWGSGRLDVLARGTRTAALHHMWL